MLICYSGHQKALIKNTICIAVLSFEDHDKSMKFDFKEKFDFDVIVDLCKVQKEAYLGSCWNGENFVPKMYGSWVLGSDFQWHPPVLKPQDGNSYIWSEVDLKWYPSTAINEAPVYTKGNN